MKLKRKIKCSCTLLVYSGRKAKQKEITKQNMRAPGTNRARNCAVGMPVGHTKQSKEGRSPKNDRS